MQFSRNFGISRDYSSKVKECILRLQKCFFFYERTVFRGCKEQFVNISLNFVSDLMADESLQKNNPVNCKFSSSTFSVFSPMLESRKLIEAGEVEPPDCDLYDNVSAGLPESTAFLGH